MANREKAARILEQYTLFMASNYPAKVTTANAERFARVTGRIKEPFSISAGDTFEFELQGVAKSKTLTSGTRTAVQLATDIDSISGVTSVDDGQGRVQITSDAVPTTNQESAIVITEPSSGTAHTILGFEVGQLDIREAIETPSPLNWEWSPGREPGSFPAHEIAEDVDWVPGPVREDSDTLVLPVRLWDSAAFGGPKAAVDKVMRHFHICDSIINDDRTAEEAWIFSEIDSMRGIPRARELMRRSKDGTSVPDATVAYLDITVRIEVRGY